MNIYGNHHNLPFFSLYRITEFIQTEQHIMMHENNDRLVIL